MNAVSVPGRKFTAYFVVASCHSVSNHVMHTPGLFCRHLSFLQLRFVGCRRSRLRPPPFRELGLELKVSHYSCTLTRCTPPNRVHFQTPASLFVTDWQFASSCSPRTDFAAAVTFSYRFVDLNLTGTFTPLHRRLRSRTTKPLRGDTVRARLFQSNCMASFLPAPFRSNSIKKMLPRFNFTSAKRSGFGCR